MLHRRTRVAANTVLIAASTLVALLLLEAGLRLFQPQPMAAVRRSSRLGWAHKPNIQMVYERSEFRITVRFSNVGLRDRDYPFEKPARTCRIAMLGDSFVEAMQVPFDSVLSERLEARLAASPPDDRRYEVINFGVSGYGTCQQLLLLEELVLRFEPDVVVSVYYHNDLDDDRRSGLCELDAADELQVLPEQRLPLRVRLISALKSAIYQHSHLWMFVSTRRPRYLNPERSASPPGGEDHGGVASCPGRHPTFESRLTLNEEPTDVARAVQLHTALWRRMAELCRAHGARFLGVIGVSQVQPEIYQQILAGEGCRSEAHDLSLPRLRLQRAATAHDIDVLDLFDPFRDGSRREQLFFYIDGHWNAGGQRVAEEALWGALKSRGLLQPVAASRQP